MQARGEVAEDGVLFVGGAALDDQLTSRGADRERGRLLEKRRKLPREAIEGRDEQRVRARIDRVLVHRHSQLDQQVGVVLWQRSVGGAGDDRAHCVVLRHPGGSNVLAREVLPREGDAVK